MQFTKFGQTGLTVSRMILGTGTFGKQTDENLPLLRSSLAQAASSS
jgi:aryl-alcohol dehydrogenase-like predicted oxidoreductase